MSPDWYGGVILLFVPVRYCPLPSVHGEKQLDPALHMIQCCFINASRILQFLVFEIIILQSVLSYYTQNSGNVNSLPQKKMKKKLIFLQNGVEYPENKTERCNHVSRNRPDFRQFSHHGDPRI